MKNLFKVAVVVAGVAATLYSCEPKSKESAGTEDTLTKTEVTPVDTVGTAAGDTSTSAKEDTSVVK